MSGFARALPVVLLATCSAVPDLDPDDAVLLDLLARRGMSARPAVWTDRDEDWAAADLVVVRSTWDYYPHRDTFVAWAAAVPAILNPADVLTWNTDKTYLRSLRDAGVSVADTTWVQPEERYDVPSVEHVVKPAISGGSKDTARYGPEDRDASVEHVRRLQQDGRVVMVQPYLADVDQHGETALLYLDGRFSHAIRKGPLLRRGAGLVKGLYAPEVIEPRQPSPAERVLAEDVFDALPFPRSDLLYARVDCVPGPQGLPVLLELELTEPSLFLATAPGAAARLADAIAARLIGSSPRR